MVNGRVFGPFNMVCVINAIIFIVRDCSSLSFGGRGASKACCCGGYKLHGLRRPYLVYEFIENI